MSTPSAISSLLARTRTSTGESLAELSEKTPVLLVLLRHEGCTFCRNAMSDIARLRRQIEASGTRIVLGHMSTPEGFATFAARYGLADVPAVEDPQCALYKGLGLKRGRLMQLIGLRVLTAWIKSTLAGHFPGKIKGDPLQLPGAFLLHHGRAVKKHTYRDASDRPDYIALATPQQAA
ncbi:SelL-related redox protein [Prosthecobacter sp.]|uniref:SelL-related redox protein n=1 Tax=Prosthecobacter sp. TaxID=1965333 RepID=UPI0037834EB7